MPSAPPDCGPAGAGWINTQTLQTLATLRHPRWLSAICSAGLWSGGRRLNEYHLTTCYHAQEKSKIHPCAV